MDAEIISEFLRDENFRAIARKANGDGLLWSDLLDMPLPSGLSATQTWDILSEVRQINAIYLPHQDQPAYQSWYTPTASMAKTIHSVDALCRADSPLSQLVMSPQGSYYRTMYQINETVCSAWRDQIVFDTKKAYRVFRLGENSKSAESKLLYNIFSTMESLDAYATEPFSPELIAKICKRILRGIDFKQLNLRTGYRESPYHGLSKSEYAAFAEQQIRTICAYANDEAGDPCEHPITKALVIRTVVCAFCPRPELAYITSQLMFNLYVVKKGMPLLSVVPFTKLILEWEKQSEIAADRNRGFVTENLGEDARGTIDKKNKRIDYTPLLILAVSLLEHAVGVLSKFVEQHEAANARIVSQFEGDKNLNRRQQMLLENAFRSADEKCTVRLHQRDHKVSYATARADILDLVARGYLIQRKQGKSFIYSIDPGLRKRFEQTARATSHSKPN